MRRMFLKMNKVGPGEQTQKCAKRWANAVDVHTYKLRPMPMASVATNISHGSSGLLNLAAWASLASGGRLP